MQASNMFLKKENDKRVIQQYIENRLSMEILIGNISDGSRITADVEGKQIIFTVV